MLRWVKILTLYSLSLFFSYCNKESEEPAPIAPTAPGPLTISNLTYNPSEITIDIDVRTFTISGSITFENAAGGIGKLRMPNSGGADITVDIQGNTVASNGIITGFIEFVMPTVPSTYTFEVWLIDTTYVSTALLEWYNKGNASINIPSNTLTDLVWSGEKYAVTGLTGY